MYSVVSPYKNITQEQSTHEDITINNRMMYRIYTARTKYRAYYYYYYYYDDDD